MSYDNTNSNKGDKERNLSDKANTGHGPQGIDKAPGEETSEDIDNFKERTQQGKQQVDADVTDEKDRAAGE